MAWKTWLTRAAGVVLVLALASSLRDAQRSRQRLSVLEGKLQSQTEEIKTLKQAALLRSTLHESEAPALAADPDAARSGTHNPTYEASEPNAPPALAPPPTARAAAALAFDPETQISDVFYSALDEVSANRGWEPAVYDRVVRVFERSMDQTKGLLASVQSGEMGRQEAIKKASDMRERALQNLSHVLDHDDMTALYEALADGVAEKRDALRQARRPRR